MTQTLVFGGCDKGRPKRRLWDPSLRRPRRRPSNWGELGGEAQPLQESFSFVSPLVVCGKRTNLIRTCHVTLEQHALKLGLALEVRTWLELSDSMPGAMRTFYLVKFQCFRDACCQSLLGIRHRSTYGQIRYITLTNHNP